ncbi:MAG TPA: hypothetical protein VGJ32_04650 [Solirubrobacteraceae bacterium]|jgi:hypothetical protein
MTRGALVVALLAVAVAALGLAAAGDGDGDARAASVTWATPPRLVTPSALPSDAVLYGEVRNDGLRAVTLGSAAVRVLDARGRRLPAVARFLQAYAPGAAGRTVTLAPGRTAPLTVAWHGPGARRIVLGPLTLAVPH